MIATAASLCHFTNLTTIKVDLHKIKKIVLALTFIPSLPLIALWPPLPSSSKGGNDAIVFTDMALCPFKPSDRSSAAVRSAGRVVAKLPESRCPSRMGCVVDSVSCPARDGSDGCCYVTTGFSGCWRLPAAAAAAAAGVNMSFRVTELSGMFCAAT